MTLLPVPSSATVTRTALANGLPLDFQVSEGVTITSTATIPWKLAVRFHLTKRRKNHPDTFAIGSGSSSIAAAGTVTVTIQFTDTAKKKLKRVRRGIPLTITTVAADGAGNGTTVTDDVSLTPGKKRR